MKRVYLDYAATTPVDERVIKEMERFFNIDFGNPSSLHLWGQKALIAVDEARLIFKKYLNTDSLEEIIFTSSATESNNFVIKGITFYYLFKKKIKPHIISTKIEHESIERTLEELKKLDLIELDLVEPDKSGYIEPDKILNLIKENTVLVSVIYVQNVIGTVQPIKKIGELLKEINKKRENLPKILFHTDAAQAGLTEDLDVKNLGVDFLTLSSHKIYGPKGAALIYKRKDIEILPLISGPGQEFGLRSSTENVPAIYGFSKAFEIFYPKREENKKYFFELRDYFLNGIKSFYQKFEINGSLENSCGKILNLYFKDFFAQEILIKLDLEGVGVSISSACSVRAAQPDKIILALGYSKERAEKSIRFSFGLKTKKEDLDYVLDVLKRLLYRG
jgi:cysteine desulfurase